MDAWSVLEGSGRVRAILGPTNTGKTHEAITRMLAHPSGMMGLPLRLLAQEVYARVVRERGEDAVALVTGEEKRVGSNARYWICTVEAMPVDRPVSFVCVDEIQLAADPERGHVFTDRLLNLRGLRETCFLGADTMVDALEALVPGVQITRKPRLSRLRYAGHKRLVRLPPRSAAVAFSVAEVYRLAEQVRRRRGGVAVVLGALSPRARNAQVGLFESGEVDHLVATDAIGMGLNLDIHHAALAATTKHDGRHHRPLRDDELAQIAGRAGRHRRDGSFGTTARAEPLSPAQVEAIEQHLFPRVPWVYWRNHQIDTHSVDALLDSLAHRPRGRWLRAAPPAADVQVLDRLVEDPRVRSQLSSSAAVGLLWDLCGVPDFGGALPHHHARFLAELFHEICDTGRIREDRIIREMRRLERDASDIDTLMARIAGIRTWTFLSHRDRWIEGAPEWQREARRIEDVLSDRLHQGLMARFVGSEGSHAVRGVRVRQGEADDRWLGVLDAADVEITLGSGGALRWRGQAVGRLAAGERWQDPRVVAAQVDGARRGELSARLDRWWRAWGRLQRPWSEPLLAERRSPLRAIAHVLDEGLGVGPREGLDWVAAALSESDRRVLARLGIVLGRRWIYTRASVDPALRAQLWGVYAQAEVRFEPTPHLGVLRCDAPRAAAKAIGFEVVGDRWVRADVVERVLVGDDLGLPGPLVRRLQGARARPSR